MPNPLDMVTQDDSLPDELQGLPRVFVRPDALPAGGNASGNQLTQAVAPEPPTDIMAIIQQVKDRLLGTGGQERYQTWPERMVRSGLTLPGDVMSGKEPIVDPATGRTSERVIERAQDVAGMAGGSALIERPGAATLGSGPIRPAGALKAAETMNTNLIKKYGSLAEAFQKWTPEEQAAFDATHTAASAPIFYSALEHATTNAAQETMSPQQWLGYLKNQPGVKAEELQWTGIGDWLGQQKGKVKKEDVQSYLDEHKVEIKDMTKHGDEGGVHYSDREYDAATDHALEIMGNEFNKLPARERAKWGDDIDAWLEEPGPRDRMSQHETDWLETNGEGGGGPHDTKYSSYQLPGGENYREHLLTTPEKPRLPDGRKPDKYDPAQQNVGNYHSSHWDEPNVLAHVRTNDRTIDGQKSLHIEEIQSDWHQEGRKKGYATSDPELKQKAEQARKDYQDSLPVVHTMIENNNNFGYRDMPEAMRKMRDQGPDVAFPNMTEEQSRIAWKAYDAFNDANDLAKQVNGGVPDAPFKTTWPELALKRMIRYAAENGYDRISWTPGEAQAARYDLSKQVDAVMIARNKDGTFSLGIKPPGKPWQPHEQNIPADKLDTYVGKDLANKAVNDPKVAEPGGHEFKGLDLKVGGEGMREFYDKMLPKMAEKIGKAHGVKVKQTPVPAKDRLQSLEYIDAKQRQRTGLTYDKELVKSVESDKAPEHPYSVHYFDLPQSLRDHAVGRGFPLYMSGVPFPLTPVDHDPFKKGK